MAQFHFVEEYERLVAHLMENHPIDEAMSQPPQLATPSTDSQSLMTYCI
jgi:hypothetical protein